jgi:uncharacterized protein DUF3551
MHIRLGLLAVPLLILATAGEASAQNYPWCAQYTFRGGARNCGFSTYAQCMATVSGVGGYCEQNAMYRPVYPGEPRRKARRHRHY